MDDNTNQPQFIPFDILKREKIHVVEPHEPTEAEPGAEFQIGTEKIRYNLPQDGVVCRVLPQYRSNPGFFHIFEGVGECILLKACYADAVRLLKQGLTLPNEALMNISRIALHAETELKAFYEFYVIYNRADDQVYVAKAEPYEFEQASGLDPYIPRPLTTEEYDQRGNAYSPSLLSRAMFQTVLPECMSFMTASILKKFPDIMHTYFLAFEAKAASPSHQIADGRAYMNISGIMNAMIDTKTDRTVFAAQFMPWQKVFDKDKPVKPELFSIHYIPLDDLEEFLDGLDKTVTGLYKSALFEASYIEPVVHLTMLGMMLYFIFQEQWLYLAKTAKMNPEKMLRLVYKTRENSVFVKGAEFELPAYFDIALESQKFAIEGTAQPIPAESVLEGLSAFAKMRKRKKIMGMLASAHKVLDMRDRLVVIAGRYHAKFREALMDSAKFLKDKGKFLNANEAFLVDLPDFRKLVHDTYYAGVQQLMQYRRSYQSRIAAQLMPYEMYAGDIPYSWRITEDQFFKAIEKKEHNCSSYNHQPQNGAVHAFDGNMDGKICCGRTVPLHVIASMGKPAAIITDIAPVFSYITEYAMIHDIPLYSGIRYSELLFPGKTVSIEEGKIIAE